MKSEPTKSSKPIENRPLAAPTEPSAARDKAKNVPRLPKFANSLVELALILGVSRQSVTRWHREPGNPGKRSDGRYPVDAWRAFLMNRPFYGGGPDGYREKCRRIQLQNEKLEFEIGQLQRRYIPVKAVEAMSAELVAKVRGIVAAIPKVAPELVSMNVPQAEARLMRLEDELLTRLHTMGSA